MPASMFQESLVRIGFGSCLFREVDEGLREEGRGMVEVVVEVCEVVEVVSIGEDGRDEGVGVGKDANESEDDD